jgi:hypothetical protein
MFLGGKGWPARKADNFTAICEPIFSIKCGILDLSQPYGPLRTLTGIALPFLREAQFPTAIKEDSDTELSGSHLGGYTRIGYFSGV